MSNRRRKTGVSSQTFKRSPSFAPQRKASDEFTSVVAAIKLLTGSLNPLLQNIRRKDTQGWLVKNMFRVLKSDVVNAKGERRVYSGDLHLLQSFAFNKQCSFTNIFSAPYLVTINRQEGIMHFNVESFVPQQSLAFPQGSTHFKVVIAAVEADFRAGSSVHEIVASGFLPVNNEWVNSCELTAAVTPRSYLPLLFVGGIEFYQKVNSMFLPLNAKSHHPLNILKVDVMS